MKQEGLRQTIEKSAVTKVVGMVLVTVVNLSLRHGIQMGVGIRKDKFALDAPEVRSPWLPPKGCSRMTAERAVEHGGIHHFFMRETSGRGSNAAISVLHWVV
jgi:hypothetical protein